MGLMILKCPKCGQSNLIKENEHYRCPVCESIVFNDDYKKYEETIERLIQEGKESDIGVLRHSLNMELEQEHLNTENIKALCRQIKAILPEDVIASFYLSYVDRKAYPRSYESFLKTLCSEDLSKYELEQIIPIIINSCDIRVKELAEELLRVKELYNEENQRQLRKALQEREEEIERYDTEKDVFVCHSSKDKEEIVRIVNAIEDNGLTCWYSGRNLPWDIENYWEGIHKAINDCKVFLFVLSKYSRMSKDVVHELDYARTIDKKVRVEYRIDDSENNIPIKRCFDGIQWIDGSKTPKYEELAERIYNGLESKDDKVIEEKFIQPQQTVDYNIIKAKLNLDKYDEAINEIEKQMSINPDDLYLFELLLIAQLKGKKEANDSARKTFNKLYERADDEYKVELLINYSFLINNNNDDNKTLEKNNEETKIESKKEEKKEIFTNKVEEDDNSSKVNNISKKETPQELFEIKVKDNEACVVGYNGNESEVVIPRKVIIDNKPYLVTTLDLKNGSSIIEKLYIPETVNKLPYFGMFFSFLRNLKYISIPLGLARYFSKSNFPKSKAYEFNKYKGGLYIGNEDNPYMVLLKTEDNAVQKFEVHSQTKHIAGEAFENCSLLTSISIPDGVIGIGMAAFSGCASLKNLKLPSKLENIHYMSFKNCTALENVHIPASVNYIYENPFIGCKCLKGISVDENNKHYDSRNDCNAIIEKSTNTLIAGCNNTIIPNNIIKIGRSAFKGMETLKSVKIPSTCEEIDMNAFDNCTKMQSVFIEEGLKYVRANCFTNCISLKTINFPSTTCILGENCFENCKSLESFIIPKGVYMIRSQLFARCTSLKTVTIPSSVEIISSGIFSHCNKLEKIIYNGSKSTWDRIKIDTGNKKLLSTNIEFKR